MSGSTTPSSPPTSRGSAASTQQERNRAASDGIAHDGGPHQHRDGEQAIGPAGTRARHSLPGTDAGELAGAVVTEPRPRLACYRARPGTRGLRGSAQFRRKAVFHLRTQKVPSEGSRRRAVRRARTSGNRQPPEPEQPPGRRAQGAGPCRPAPISANWPRRGPQGRLDCRHRHASGPQPTAVRASLRDLPQPPCARRGAGSLDQVFRHRRLLVGGANHRSYGASHDTASRRLSLARVRHATGLPVVLRPDWRQESGAAMVRVLTWNVEWATPRSRRSPEILRRIRATPPEVVCLTEAHAGLAVPDGYAICSRSDYGYGIKGGRREVMLWSREPWERVDDAGADTLPPGRFVSGVTRLPSARSPSSESAFPGSDHEPRRGARPSPSYAGKTINSSWLALPGFLRGVPRSAWSSRGTSIRWSGQAAALLANCGTRC